jgi:hypothetical protein
MTRFSYVSTSGVKLSDASKKLGKKFATGASVTKVCCIAGLKLLDSNNCQSCNKIFLFYWIIPGRAQLRRSKLMFKETYLMTLWSSLQIHGLM